VRDARLTGWRLVRCVVCSTAPSTASQPDVVAPRLASPSRPAPRCCQVRAVLQCEPLKRQSPHQPRADLVGVEEAARVALPRPALEDGRGQRPGLALLRGLDLDVLHTRGGLAEGRRREMMGGVWVCVR
jgi:hypothetical protein